MIMPQIFTMLTNPISQWTPSPTFLSLSSAMIGVYLRFYQFSFALLRAMQ
jgi:hypothetical protein